jgi:hypothetical protein
MLEDQPSLAQRLAQWSPVPIFLRLNQNRSVYLSVRKKGRRGMHISLHEIFLQAPDEVLKAVIDYSYYKKKEAHKALRAFVHSVSINQKPGVDRAVSLQTKGDWLDLELLYRKVNAHYFSDELDLDITFFPAPFYPKGRSFTFGTYQRERKLIRINKMLDRPDVPIFFTEFIIYHEMLHEVVPPVLDSLGRMRIHTPEFKKKEKEFIHYHQAVAFEKKWMQQKRKWYGRS